MPGERQVQEKVLQYEAFVSEVLQRDLRKVLEQRDQVYEKMAQYLQLKNIIERLQETGSQELTTQVDLGCNFYVNAEVPDASTIFVALGYGFFVELTLPEALAFIEKKNKLLTEACMNSKVSKICLRRPEGTSSFRHQPFLEGTFSM
ncbi:protein UXT isoform X2 [Podarcis raffonei]|uniref:protein UXT isoform X2 n=1 Tax=Podarcis muralis TaxID=64176 RepID=UPI00109FD75F|nr:protein UXT isoform X2 [Podarcis muralis]XP_053226810.1 protein UXT isoform X2 [Podarcis raffonei]